MAGVERFAPVVLVGALAVALAAYAAFKLRERRKPGGKGGPGPGGVGQIEPMFLERYVPDGDDVGVEPEAAR